MSTHPVIALLGPTLLALFGAGLAYAGYRQLEPELRRLRDEPLAVRDAPTSEGLRELRGTVEPAEHYVESPYTGTDCVAFEYEVEEYVSSGKHSHWDTLASGQQAIAFRLADDTGSILVDPAGSDLTLKSEWEVEVGAEETVGGRVREFLERLDVEPGEASEFSVGPLSVGTGDRRRYTERRLDLGETVSVFGPVEYDPAAGGDWGSDEVDAAVRQREGAPFVVADTPSVPVVRRGNAVGGGLLAGGVAIVAYGVWLAAAALLAAG